MTSSTVTILLVEDDKVDRMAIRRSFRELKIANPVIEASNGIEALDMLRGEGGFEKVPQPCLILLDLNMPQMGGIEFLEVLRSDPVLHNRIVFVMTTSAAEEDRMHAYDHNVAGYILKERAGKDFLESIGMLELYWRVIQFPE
jgi:CheY-like chemotaxis protein